MTEGIFERTVSYFEREGRHNLLDTLRVVRACAVKDHIRKAVVFSADGAGALQAWEELHAEGVSVCAACLPARWSAGSGAKDRTMGLSEDARSELARKGIQIVEGNLPFQDIFLPEARDRVLMAIRSAFACVSGALPLCVEAVLMACEAGYVLPGEMVIGMASDTAIIARASLKMWMFTPFGLEIKEIICKPRNLTVTRRQLYEEEKPAETKVKGGGSPRRSSKDGKAGPAAPGRTDAADAHRKAP